MSFFLNKNKQDTAHDRHVKCQRNRGGNKGIPMKAARIGSPTLLQHQKISDPESNENEIFFLPSQRVHLLELKNGRFKK